MFSLFKSIGNGCLEELDVSIFVTHVYICKSRRVLAHIYTYNIIKHAIIEKLSRQKLVPRKKNLGKQKKIGVMENLQTVTISQRRQREI